MSSEIRANIIICSGFVLAIYQNINSFNSYELSLTCLNCISVLLFTFSSCSFGKEHHYRISENGLPCCLLIPLINIITHVSNGDKLAYTLFCNGLVSTSLVPLLQEQISNKKSSSSSLSSCLNMLASLSLVASKFYLLVLMLINIDPFTSFIILSILLFLWFVQRMTPDILPGSFTYGELAILTQGGVCILMSFFDRLWPLFGKDGHTMTEDEDMLVIFSQVAVISCLLFVIAIGSKGWFRRDVVRILLLLVFEFLFITYPMLHCMMPDNLLVWMFEMIFNSKTSVEILIRHGLTSYFLLLQIFLVAYWSVCAAIAILLAVGFSLVTPTSEEKKIAKRSEKTKIRKLFHLIIGLVFLPGLLVDCRLLFLASVVAMVALIVVESLRFFNVPPIGETIRQSFSVFLDDQDRGLVVLTPIYLLIGCSSSLWLSIGCEVQKIVSLVGLLSLGIGDSAASYFGSKYGNHHWKESQKTVEGTLASIISQIIFVASIQLSGVEVIGSFSILKLLTSVILSSLYESFTLQIDNLVLPLFAYLLMC